LPLEPVAASVAGINSERDTDLSAVGGGRAVGVWAMEGTSSGHAALAAGLGEAFVSAAGVGSSPVVAVRLVVSGKVHDVSTNASTAGELLSAMGIEPGADDRVLPSPSAPLLAGGYVRFDDISISEARVREPIPHSVLTRLTDVLPAGTIQLLRSGLDGVALATYRVIRENGELVSRELLGRWIVSAPIPEVRVAGRGTPQPSLASVPSPGARVQDGEATWYDPPWSGYTAAHPSLPFGTEVTVTDPATGRSVVVTINDRGPFAPGRIIDLSPEAFRALAPLGRGVLDVRISW
jgi:hypothetical protein